MTSKQISQQSAREVTLKVIFLYGRTIKRGWVKGRPLRKKLLFFQTAKGPTAIKLNGGGGKASMARSLKNNYFLRLPLEGQGLVKRKVSNCKKIIIRQYIFVYNFLRLCKFAIIKTYNIFRRKEWSVKYF